MGSGPQIGDAFGELLQAVWDYQAGGEPTSPLAEVVERDDGEITLGSAKAWLAPPKEWPEHERKAADRLRGRVLDVGAGAGRVSLLLQERGIEVGALDISPGAIDVCKKRGVYETVARTVDEHAATGHRYDSFAFFGNNLGLFESRQRARVVLDLLASMACPGACIVGLSADPHTRADPLTVAYMESNRAAGKLPGQLRIRVRYRNLATPWFDYLTCSAAELQELTAGSRWELTEVEHGPGPCYTAVLLLQ